MFLELQPAIQFIKETPSLWNTLIGTWGAPTATTILGGFGLYKMQKWLKDNKEDHKNIFTFIDAQKNLLNSLKNEKDVILAIATIINSGQESLSMLNSEENIKLFLETMRNSFTIMAQNILVIGIDHINENQIDTILSDNRKTIAKDFDLFPPDFIAQYIKPKMDVIALKYCCQIKEIVNLSFINNRTNQFRTYTEAFVLDQMKHAVTSYYLYKYPDKNN